MLNRLVKTRGAPKYLFADNGAEFTGHLVDLWAYHHALLWQILNDQAFLGFPWIILRDSWVVGDLEADHERELEVRS